MTQSRPAGRHFKENTVNNISERLMNDMSNAVREYLRDWARLAGKRIDWDKATMFIAGQALQLANSNGDADGYKLSDANKAAWEYVQNL